MIAALKPYPEYKESGLPWLGRVPRHWGIKRLKAVVSLNPSKSESRSLLRDNALATFLPMERVGTDGRIDAHEQLPASTLWNGFTYFRRDDVLLAKITPCFENGKGACLSNLPTEIGFGSTEFHVLRPKSELSPRFIFLQTSLAIFRDLGARSMTGSAGQQRVSSRFVEEHQILIPPPDEQTAIVRFLAYANHRLEKAIRAKGKVIALLNEQKQVIIHRAVTRGLDPNVCLKPSGISWLGEIPGNWETRKLKYLASTIGGMTPNKGVARYWKGDVPWISPKDMKSREITDSQDHISTAALRETGISVIQPPAVLIVVRGMILNRLFPVAVTKIPVTVNQDMKALIPKRGVNADFLVSLLSGIPREILLLVEESGHGTKCLRTDVWANLLLPLPPHNEQQRINELLKSELNDVNTSIIQTEREIALLREYRTRLIADVVTGKIDVREAVARLPNEADEPAAVNDSEDQMFEDDEQPTAGNLNVMPDEAGI